MRDELTEDRQAGRVGFAQIHAPTFAGEVQGLISKRQFHDAEKLLREKLKQEPTHPEAFYLLGVSNYFQGQIGMAVENLKKALELNPKNTDAAICLSVVLNDVGKYSEAKKAFDQANLTISSRQASDLEIDRKFAVKHLELGDLYFRYRRYDEAIEEYTKSTQLDPTTFDTRIKRAKAYSKKGLNTRALQELTELKAELPSYLAPRLQIGLLLYSQGNVLDAELEWETALALDPNNRELHTYLSMAKRARVGQ